MNAFFDENYDDFCSYNISMVHSSLFGMKDTEYMKNDLLEQIKNGKDFTKHEYDPTQLFSSFEYLDDEMSALSHPLIEMLEHYAEYICESTPEEILTKNYVFKKWGEMLSFLGYEAFYPVKRDYYELEKFVWTVCNDEKIGQEVVDKEWKGFDINLHGNELGCCKS